MFRILGEILVKVDSDKQTIKTPWGEVVMGGPASLETHFDVTIKDIEAPTIDLTGPRTPELPS